MSDQVESRIVEMKFNNAQFESGAAAALKLLELLKTKLNFDSSKKSLDSLGSVAKHFSFKHMADGVTAVTDRFKTLGIVGASAINSLTNRAVGVGLEIGKAFAITPVTSGFSEYETKLGSIQTILANTAKFGTKLPEVNNALNELNDYADKTIYNFGQMTQNVGLFTNAGLKLSDSVAMIRGFSNAAAASGANAEGAARAAFQLSQALATGVVRAQDWMSLTNAGLGNKNMQDALIGIANAMGTVKKAGTSTTEILKKGFRGSLEDGWLSADVMSKYLRIMAGDMTAAEMAALGLSKTQIKTFQEQQKTAEEAATKVRTFTQLVSTMKEAIGSGWSETFETIFGDFNEATDLFTDVNNSLGGMVQASAAARNKLLKDWKALGGRTVLIEGIKTAFQAVLNILKPIRDAFRDIFPKKTAEDLLGLTKGFADLATKMLPSVDTMANLHRTFRGVFAAMDIVKQVIVGVISGFARLFSAVGGGSGSFLGLTGSIGDFIYGIDLMLKKSGSIGKFFTNIADLVAVPLKLITNFAKAVVDMFQGFDPSGSNKLNDALDRMGERLSPLEAMIKGIKRLFGGLGDLISNTADAIGKALVKISTAIASNFSAEGFKSILDAVNTGLFAALVIAFKRFTSGGLLGVVKGTGGGLFGQIRGALSDVTNTLSIMQQKLKAKILTNIAVALALLTASIFVLSSIDSDKLTKAMTAMAVGFGGLQLALLSLASAFGPMAAVKLPFITTSLIALGGALILFATSLKILASINPEDTGRSLLNMAAMLFIMTKAMKALSKDVGGMIRAAAALTIMGVALNVIAVAMKLFATMSWDDMAHGLAALAGALMVIVATMRLMPKDMLLQAAALDLLGIALAEIAAALLIFNTMSWDSMAHGLTVLAGSLVAIAVGMRLMPKGMLLQAVALNAVGVALTIIAGAVKLMATMSWEAIGKGLVVLGGALLILSVGLNSMSTAIFGAAALVVAAGALAVLTPILVTLGSLSWESIIKGLTALAGVFVILGVAGALLAPAVPVILGLGAALVLMGAGFALAGVGALAFATALGIIIGAGSAAISVLGDIIGTFINAIPTFMQALAIGLVNIAVVIAQSAPKFTQAFVAIMNVMLNTVLITIPKIGLVFLQLINTGLKILGEAVPRMITTGLKILLAFLKGIKDNIGKMADTVTDIIVEFLRAYGRNAPKIIDAGFKMIIDFINGITKAIDKNAEELGRAGARMGIAIAKGMVKGLWAGGGEVASAAKGVAKSALKGAMGFLGIHSPSKKFIEVGKFTSEGFAIGITAYSNKVANAASGIGGVAVDNIKSSLDKVGDALTGELDMTPVIAPVVDLSQFRKDAASMAKVMSTSPLEAKLSYSQASSISADKEAAIKDQLVVVAPTNTEPTVITFEQKNYSPKALSTVDIYRNTKNQLSQAKDMLGLPA